MREEEKEENIDVEVLREVMICTQEKKDLDVFSTGKSAADELAVTRDEVNLSSMVSTAHEQTSNIVMLVLENLFEAMYKQMNQCNNSEITSGENVMFLFHLFMFWMLISKWMLTGNFVYKDSCIKFNNGSTDSNSLV